MPESSEPASVRRRIAYGSGRIRKLFRDQKRHPALPAPFPDATAAAAAATAPTSGATIAPPTRRGTTPFDRLSVSRTSLSRAVRKVSSSPDFSWVTHPPLAQILRAPSRAARAPDRLSEVPSPLRATLRSSVRGQPVGRDQRDEMNSRDDDGHADHVDSRSGTVSSQENHPSGVRPPASPSASASASASASDSGNDTHSAADFFDASSLTHASDSLSLTLSASTQIACRPKLSTQYRRKEHCSSVDVHSSSSDSTSHATPAGNPDYAGGGSAHRSSDSVTPSPPPHSSPPSSSPPPPPPPPPPPASSSRTSFSPPDPLLKKDCSEPPQHARAPPTGPGSRNDKAAHAQGVVAKAAAVAQLRTADVQQTEAELQADIDHARRAMHLFLNSDMRAAEEMVQANSDRRLYRSLGTAIFAVFKAFMTLDHYDLTTAASYAKDAMTVASLLRRPTSIASVLGRFARGSSQHGPAVYSMTPVQRHAELVFAESSLLKSIMGILLSGDWFACISEALQLRNVYGMYRSLARYLDWLDDPQQVQTGCRTAHAADEDFRSGVYLGNGTISLVFGLLPGAVLTIAQVFGCTGDCSEGLRMLARAGRWAPPSPPPSVVDGSRRHASDATTTATLATPSAQSDLPPREGGLRRVMCDMVLLSYHLILSTFLPLEGVDRALARTILMYHLKRYPKGMFFRYFSGRWFTNACQPGPAIEQFAQARDIQRDYLQLRHICIWDMAVCSISLCDWTSGAACFQTLLRESSWSPAIYSYGLGTMLFSALDAHTIDAPADQADLGPGSTIATGVGEPEAFSPGGLVHPAAREALFCRAHGLITGATSKLNRIAGKSISLEKFVVKKVAKFEARGHLFLPGLELGYMLQCLHHVPSQTLREVHRPLLARILCQLGRLKADPSEYRLPPARGERPGSPLEQSQQQRSLDPGAEWLADWCLVHFLNGVVHRYIAHPSAHVDGPVRRRAGAVPPRSSFSSNASDGETGSSARDEAKGASHRQAEAELRAASDGESEESFRTVTHMGPGLASDHYLLYFAHMELGRLFAARGDADAARSHLELVLSGQALEHRRAARRGKYALQDMCMLQAHGALGLLLRA